MVAIKNVSIIIVSWNTRSHLYNCLTSVYKQISSVNFEVIVIDNGSGDGSQEMVENQYPQVTLIKNATNRGFAAANNQGIAVAQGRYVLLLNSDTVVLHNSIDRVVSFADTHPDAAVVGCRVLNPDGTLQPTCFMFPSVLNMLLSSTYLYKIFPGSRFFGRERMSWWLRDDVREVDVVTGCFMLVRRDAIEQVGRLDEQFFMYAEEADWCYRFKQRGWKVLFTPDAEIIHYGGQSTKQTAVEMMLQVRGSILQFMRKHRTVWEYKVACFFIWLFLVLRIPVWFIRAVLARGNNQRPRVYLSAYIAGTKILMSRGGRELSTGPKLYSQRGSRTA